MKIQVARRGGSARWSEKEATDLAALLQARGDLAGARPLAEGALAIWEKTLGVEHPITNVGLRGFFLRPNNQPQR